MSKEAMKLALEALVKSVDNFPANRKHRHAIWQVREALAEQPAQQKPVSCVLSQQEMAEAAKRYTSPPQRTWVGLKNEEIYSVLENLQVMYNRPPTTDSRIIFARAIEAKLREKNT